MGDVIAKDERVGEDVNHEPRCSILMSGGIRTGSRRCGRPIYHCSEKIDQIPVCLMHSKDPLKDRRLFLSELDNLLGQTSGAAVVYLSGFIFPDVDFQGRSFASPVCFCGAEFKGITSFENARFMSWSDFSDARFDGVATFVRAEFADDAVFLNVIFNAETKFGDAIGRGAEFREGATFSAAQFKKTVEFVTCRFLGGGGNFSSAMFHEAADFTKAEFGPAFPDSLPSRGDFILVPDTELKWVLARSEAVADFRWVRFLSPEAVSFYQVNRHSLVGLRLHCVGCNLDGVPFTDVHWCRYAGRVTIEDDLQLRFAMEVDDWRGLRGDEPSLTFESVASAYRQLVINFEKSKDFDLAEDCFYGCMEMKRLDPGRALLLRKMSIPASGLWQRIGKRCLGQFGILNIYRCLSAYGSSYRRGLAVLSLLLIFFGLLFPFTGLRMANDISGPGQALDVFSWRSPVHLRNFINTFGAGMWASVEVAMFQKNPTIQLVGKWGRRLAGMEVIVVSGQVALIFLALRRRFRF